MVFMLSSPDLAVLCSVPGQTAATSGPIQAPLHIPPLSRRAPHSKQGPLQNGLPCPILDRIMSADGDAMAPSGDHEEDAGSTLAPCLADEPPPAPAAACSVQVGDRKR
jgi:hypothetical protein